MLRSVVLAALSACVVGIACTSFSSANDPEGGLPEGGLPEAALPDAALAEAGDAPSSSEAAAPDVGCMAYPRAFFCDDFNIGAWDNRWDVLPPGAQGLTVATTSAWPSKALSVTVPGNASPTPHLVRDHLGLGVTPTVVQIDFLFHAEAFDPAAPAAGALAAFGPTGIDQKPHLRLELNAGRLALIDYEPPSTYTTLASTPYSTKAVRVSIVLDYSSAPPKASLGIDDIPKGGATLPAAFPAATDPSIYLGLSFLSGTTSPWTLSFDDYVLTAM